MIGQILLGGIPYLDKDDNIDATWTLNGTVEMTWEGKRNGVPLCCKKTYALRHLPFEEQLYNMFFEEVNYHLKELTERYYIRNNYVVPLDRIKPNLATLNEITTKSGLHHLLLNGGEYEEPWLFKDCATTDCVRTIVTHTTAGSVEPIRNSDGCPD